MKLGVSNWKQSPINHPEHPSNHIATHWHCDSELARANTICISFNSSSNALIVMWVFVWCCPWCYWVLVLKYWTVPDLNDTGNFLWCILTPGISENSLNRLCKTEFTCCLWERLICISPYKEICFYPVSVRIMFSSVSPLCFGLIPPCSCSLPFVCWPSFPVCAC